MISRYRVLAERLRAEIQALEKVVKRAKGALVRATQQPQDQEYFISAAALDLHSFYAGVERLFQLIAGEIDGGVPAGSRWHRDLLEEMTLEISEVRPAVILPETQIALIDYLEFRHVVRNVYSFDLRSERVAELGNGLNTAFSLVQRDLLAFAEFLDELSNADDTA
jgi:hypothetical protein